MTIQAILVMVPLLFLAGAILWGIIVCIRDGEWLMALVPILFIMFIIGISMSN